jgi:hypothetical protein
MSVWLGWQQAEKRAAIAELLHGLDPPHSVPNGDAVAPPKTNGSHAAASAEFKAVTFLFTLGAPPSVRSLG